MALGVVPPVISALPGDRQISVIVVAETEFPKKGRW
jgi:hypothetical protein